MRSLALLPVHSAAVTLPQSLWAAFPDLVRKVLNLSESDPVPNICRFPVAPAAVSTTTPAKLTIDEVYAIRTTELIAIYDSIPNSKAGATTLCTFWYDGGGKKLRLASWLLHFVRTRSKSKNRKVCVGKVACNALNADDVADYRGNHAHWPLVHAQQQE